MNFSYVYDDSNGVLMAKGLAYAMMTVEFDEDRQQYIATVWGETNGSYYDPPEVIDIDSSVYDTKEGAKAWCEAMDIIGFGQELMYETPLIEMEVKMKENGDGR